MKKIFLAFLLSCNTASHAAYSTHLVNAAYGMAQILCGCTLLTVTSPKWIPETIIKHYRDRRLNKQNQIKQSKPAIFQAINQNDVATLKSLTKQCTLMVFDDQGNTPLHVAARLGDERIFRIALRANPELLKIKNSQDKIPLEVAVAHGKANIIQLLSSSLDNRSWLSKFVDWCIEGIDDFIEPIPQIDYSTGTMKK